MDDLPVGSPVRVNASTGVVRGKLIEYSSIPGCCLVELLDGSTIAAPVCLLEPEHTTETSTTTSAPPGGKCIRGCGDSTPWANGPYVCWRCARDG